MHGRALPCTATPWTVRGRWSGGWCVVRGAWCACCKPGQRHAARPLDRVEDSRTYLPEPFNKQRVAVNSISFACLHTRCTCTAPLWCVRVSRVEKPPKSRRCVHKLPKSFYRNVPTPGVGFAALVQAGEWQLTTYDTQVREPSNFRRWRSIQCSLGPPHVRRNPMFFFWLGCIVRVVAPTESRNLHNTCF